MTSQNARRAVIYTRISRDNKQGSGLGVGKQEHDCRELAGRLGAEVVAVRQDNDITAFKGSSRSKRRPGYEALLEDIKTGRADAVIAWHTDRLHRDTAELEGYIRTCGEGADGVPTYTVQGGNLDLTTASGRMLAKILGAVAQGEIEHMIERMKAGHERTRDAGGYRGGPRPFGYRKDGLSVKNGGQGRLTQVPEEAAAIRKACDDVLAGIGAHTIAKQWNGAGMLTTAGKPWNNVNVRLVLIRALNAGLIEYGVGKDGKGAGTIVGKGNWDPIVDEDTWRAVRAILTDPARRTGPGPKTRHLLTGVLICGVCGGHKFRTIASKWGNLYQCAALGHRPAGEPGPKRWHLARKQEPLDAMAEQAVIGRLGRPDAITALNRPGADLAALEARRGALRARLDELGALFAAGAIDGMQLTAGSKPLRGQLDGAEQALSEAHRGSALEEFAGGADPAAVWDSLTMERKRAVVALLLRIKVLPVGKGGTRRGKRITADRHFPADLDTVEILWQTP